MISKIRGKLDKVGNGFLELVCGDMTYCVLIPVILLDKIKGQEGEAVEFYTYHYYEVEKGSGNMIPRIIGFNDEIEKEFFEKFITVKRIGVKTALTAINIPIEKIAKAIELRDTGVLSKLPKIGKRAAEQIVAELKGKMDKFIVGSVKDEDVVAEKKVDDYSQSLMDEALAILTQLDYKKSQAQEMIEKTLKHSGTKFNSVEELIQAIYASSFANK